MMPNEAIKVTMEVPPKLIRGSGTPTTGNSPVTIPVLTKV
jgi:hypothetical protein